MRHTYHTTLEELYDSAVDVEVTVEVTPGDPGYYRNANGDGCPPTPAMAELQSVMVTKVYGEYTDRDRIQMSIVQAKRWDERAFERLSEIWGDGESDRALEDASEAAEEDRY